MDIEHFENWNPWWRLKRVPKVLAGVSRELDNLIFKSLEEREITILTGIRRAGKTTIMYQMIDHLLENNDESQILYLNFDDELLNKNKLEEIYNFYKQNKNPDKKAYIFFDEIQNIVEWEKFIKKYYDLRKNIKFVVSGSSADLLKQEYSTLLTGRNLTFRISPLSFTEFLKFEKIDIVSINTETKNKILYRFNRFLKNGGFPEAYFKEKEIRHILLKEYFDDIIYKDIVGRYNISSKKVVELAVYLLTNISSLFTIRKIRNYTGLSIDSIRDYLSYLENSFLIKTLDYFSYSLKQQTTMPKKVYCVDNGLRNAVSFKFSQDYGRLVENLVFIELNRRGAESFYWKDSEGREVDFVLKGEGGTLTAINVTYANEINTREIKGLLEFRKEFRKCKHLLILTKNLEEEIVRDGLKIRAVPVWKWMLENTER